MKQYNKYYTYIYNCNDYYCVFRTSNFQNKRPSMDVNWLPTPKILFLYSSVVWVVSISFIRLCCYQCSNWPTNKNNPFSPFTVYNIILCNFVRAQPLRYFIRNVTVTGVYQPEVVVNRSLPTYSSVSALSET